MCYRQQKTGAFSTRDAAEVAQVEEKYSIAKNVSMSSVPARGDKVEALESASSMDFASGWKNWPGYVTG